MNSLPDQSDMGECTCAFQSASMPPEAPAFCPRHCGPVEPLEVTPPPPTAPRRLTVFANGRTGGVEISGFYANEPFDNENRWLTFYVDENPIGKFRVVDCYSRDDGVNKAEVGWRFAGWRFEIQPSPQHSVGVRE